MWFVPDPGCSRGRTDCIRGLWEGGRVGLAALVLPSWRILTGLVWDVGVSNSSYHGLTMVRPTATEGSH